jgi:hypothetical protein
MDFSTMSNEDLAASLAEKREKATALFALDAPTIEQVDEAEALVASIGEIEGEQATRAAAVKDAADRFAAAKQNFSVNDGVETSEDGDDEDDEDQADETEEEADEADESGDDGETVEASVEDDSESTDEETPDAVTASVNHTKSQVVKASAKTNVAKRVGRKTTRPKVAETPPVTITAAADVPQYATGSDLGDMETTAKALMNRVKGFAPHNKRSAQAVRSQSGGQPVLNRFGVASFNLNVPEALTASKASEDYDVVKAAIKGRMGDPASGTLTAAGWCAPSETVFSFIADYVVDGLVTVPEVGAPRGGLNITTGPARSSQGAALDDFGFVQTEAEAEAGTEKTCETIVCPDFEDHRLDAIGYCYKIPLLTQKAYPELITDALRFAGVLYAHKVNARIIADMVALSTAVNAAPYGATFTDTLEALSIIAVKERRKWNVGQNAVMEVKMPEFAREVFRADMSRRNAVAVDAVTDQQIDAHFTARRLAVEYVADWQEMTGADAAWPSTFDAMIFPAGTFIKAVEDVINLSAVYDAASLTVNEYTGVFFEQGILVAQAGYGSSVVTVPICTAGLSGGAVLDCLPAGS